MNTAFFVQSIMLGVGLAMDALPVSLANGLHDPKMKFPKMSIIAGVFAFFQALMPLTGWFCVHTLLEFFSVFEKFIPWIALILLLFIGGNMLIEGIKNKEDTEEVKKLSLGVLLIQGVATSIDALSVGFTIAEHDFLMALVAVLLIAAVTFIICLCGIYIGKKFGTKLSNKASILGGSILIVIGIYIFLSGIMG